MSTSSAFSLFLVLLLLVDVFLILYEPWFSSIDLLASPAFFSLFFSFRICFLLFITSTMAPMDNVSIAGRGFATAWVGHDIDDPNNIDQVLLAMEAFMAKNSVGGRLKVSSKQSHFASMPVTKKVSANLLFPFTSLPLMATTTTSPKFLNVSSRNNLPRPTSFFASNPSSISRIFTRLRPSLRTPSRQRMSTTSTRKATLSRHGPSSPSPRAMT